MGKGKKIPKKQPIKNKRVATKKTVELKPGMIDENGKKVPPPRHFCWRPGQSGNPAGRKKGPRLRTILRSSMEKQASDVPAFEAIAKKLKLDPKKFTVGEVFVFSTLLHAARGKSVAMKEVWERIDGKVDQNIRVNDGTFDILSDDQLDGIIEEGKNGIEKHKG